MFWVIGCNGMLGTELCRQLKEHDIAFCGTDRNVDISSFEVLDAFTSEQAALGKTVSAIVNCAAYTAVDKAESEPELAAKLNAEGPRNIARLAKKLSVPLVHISTDYVFDGTGTAPYTEEAERKPLGVYGVTKADGERAVQKETDAYYILRTAWLYGWAGKNFVYTMIRAMNSRESVKVVSDQRGTPTSCTTLASIIVRILEGVAKKSSFVPYGIYHVTDEGAASWFSFASEIKKQALSVGLLTNSACVVTPCSTEEYPTPAKRPAYSVLSKKKIQAELGIKLPSWEESLTAFLQSPLFDKTRI